MPVISGPVKKVEDEELDTKALRIFLKALEIVGGPRKLIEYRNLTWIPSLLEAAYVVVLKEEYFKSADEIAAELGISKNTVREIFKAQPAKVEAKLRGESEEEKTHIAGGLAKLAYEEIKQGNDSIAFIKHFFSEAYKAAGLTWPLEVMERIRGEDFPISRERAIELLKGSSVEEAAKRIEKEEIKSPAELLHLLKKSGAK